MRFKYSIPVVFVLALVIIEKENKIISRVSDKLALKQPQLSLPPDSALQILLKPNQNASLTFHPRTSAPVFTLMKRRLENYNNTRQSPPKASTKHKHILLLATTRTGSSFAGEFFNQQGDNMFYLFEPLWHVEKMLTLEGGGTNATASARAYRDVLRRLFQCDFSLLESFIEPPPVDHVTANLFRRWSSSSLCAESVCSPFVQGDFEKFHCKTRKCGALNLTLASQSCLRKEHRAIKSVRVRQLETLRPLAEDPRLDVKFIQLVRDPRAVLASRMVAFEKYKNWKEWATQGKVPLDDDEVRKLRGNCDNIRTSAQIGLKRPKWLRGRYMLVRYEDIARFPMRKAAEMYAFAGIPFTPRVKAWIARNTQVSQAEASGVYSLQRNSSEHVEKWRFSLPFKVAQVVQKVCRPTLKLFGYKVVNSEKMLTDRSISLIEDKVFNSL
ncbi:carbohydrate sulfotransferase 3-like [Eucyclogobius newberryi]|uniref:carbohydrate sulfotransferase 3-like n=1 Tax=Eucyclogobius newberryi TaxID=166745 RepID=UPI003B5BAC55